MTLIVLRKRLSDFGNQRLFGGIKWIKILEIENTFKKTKPDKVDVNSETCRVPELAISLINLRKWVSKFGNQRWHLRNQMDKFWKSKVSFEDLILRNICFGIKPKTSEKKNWLIIKRDKSKIPWRNKKQKFRKSNINGKIKMKQPNKQANKKGYLQY